MLRASLFAIVLLTASCSEPAPLVTLTNARVIAQPASAAAYFTLTNSGGDDRLLSVEAPEIGSVTLHETSMDGSVMRMRPIKGAVEVKGGAKVDFTPYGKHAMIKLGRPLGAQKSVRLRFNFERQAAVLVDAPVQSPTGGMH